MNHFDLLEFLLRGILLLSLAWLLGWKISRDGSAHHYWKGVFALLSFMALLGFAPSLRWLNLSVEQFTVPPSMMMVTNDIAAELAPAITPGVEVLPQISLKAGTERPQLKAMEPATVLCWIWLAGVVIGLIRWSHSRFLLTRLLRGAVPLSIDGENVLCSDQVTAPLSFGLLRRGIAVPSNFELWPAAEREMALRHERCHLRRRDGLWQMCATLLAILHWPIPLVWLALRRLERECELAVDAEVLDSGISPTGYSELLVRLASAEGSATTTALAMARKSTVPLRVERILNLADRTAASRGVLHRVAGGLLGGVAITLGLTSLMGQTATSIVEVDGAEEVEEVQLFTAVYEVPPNFIQGVSKDTKKISMTLVEQDRRLAQEFLSKAGIGFPEGSSAYYQFSKSKLTVSNTKENLKLVEALIGSEKQLSYQATKQVLLSVRMTEVPIGFETDGIDFLSSDTTGEIAGVLTDLQALWVFRDIQKLPDVDLWTLPSLTVRSGKKGKIETLAANEGLPNLTLETTAVMGADGYTINLKIHELIDASGTPVSISIWDGQSVVWHEHLDGNRVRSFFLRARSVDSEGIPAAFGNHVPQPGNETFEGVEK